MEEQKAYSMPQIFFIENCWLWADVKRLCNTDIKNL